MAKTENSYSPSEGQVIVTLSSGNVTAMGSPFATAEAITIDGVVRSFMRTNNPERPIEDTYVTGSSEPIVTKSNKLPREEWKLVILDDYSKGETGEWGTDNITAYQLFKLLHQEDQEPSALSVCPAFDQDAASNTGKIVYTLSSPIYIKSVGIPKADADDNKPNEVEILISCPAHTTSAHA